MNLFTSAGMETAKYVLERQEARDEIRRWRREILQGEGRESLPLGGMRRRRELLEAAFHKFERASQRLAARLTRAGRDKLYADTQKVQRWYVLTGDALEEAAAEREPATPLADSTRLPAMDNLNRTEIIRMEAPRRPELLPFDGNPLSWPAFRDRFTAEVHNRDHIDDVMKLIHLQKMCIGEAKTILGDWQPIGANYGRAWITLKEKFEDNYQIEQALVSQMLNMQQVREETRPALRGLIDTVTNATRQLQSVGVDIGSWDPMVLGLMIRLLPARVKDVWEQRRDVQCPPTLRDMLAFLEARARGKVYTDAPRPQAVGENRAFMRNSFDQPRQMANPGGPRSGVGCKLCPDRHPLFRCPVMTEAGMEKRQRLVRNLRVCQVCLANHSGRCGQRCFGCKGPHHQLLCPTARGPLAKMERTMPYKSPVEARGPPKTE